MNIDLKDVYNVVLKNRENILNEWLESKSLSVILKHINMDKS